MGWVMISVDSLILEAIGMSDVVSHQITLEEKHQGY